MKYFLVLLGTAIYYSTYAFLSKKINDSESNWVMALTFVFGALCPFWIIMSRISDNLLRDALIYDFVLMSSFTLTLILLGAGEAFTRLNWFGAILVCVGIVCMKIK